MINLRNEMLDEVLRDLNRVQQELSELEARIQSGADGLRVSKGLAAEAEAGYVQQQEAERGAVTITRQNAEGITVFEVEEVTAVLPGDVVRVPRLDDAPPVRADRELVDPSDVGFVLDGQGDAAATE